MKVALPAVAAMGCPVPANAVRRGAVAGRRLRL